MKKKYSTLLNFALAACVATTFMACSKGDNSTSTSTSNDTSVVGPIIGQDAEPLVNIGGNVFDTNGIPLAGVTVSCEGVQATTNSSGQYVIEDLRVHNVTGSREGSTNAENEFDHPVQCVVEAPAGYLGAAVWVYPDAQVLNTIYDNTSDAPGGQTNQPLFWVDGMFAQAATAWLPKLDSEVCGVLRFCSTGEPVRDTQLRLDMWAVDNNDVDEQAQAHGYTSDISYSTGLYQTTTNAEDGTFCIANVPDDSILRLYATQYQELSVSGNGYAEVDCDGTKPCNAEGAYISTVNEGLLTLGNVCVNAIPASDSIRPCVANIGGWVMPAGLDPDGDGYVTVDTPWSDDTLELAVLSDNIDGTDGINIIFNESLRAGAINANSVVVWDMDDEEYITAFTSSLAGRTLTVTTANPIPEGHHILVYLLRDDFIDLAGNFLYADDLPNNSCNYVRFAEEFYSLNGTGYVVVGFRIYASDDTNVEPATDLAQNCLDYSKTVSNQTDLQGEYQTVFRSETSSSNTFYNLNDDEDYEYRLEALADVLECPSDDASAADIVSNYASVSFVSPTSGSWEISGDGTCTSNCDDSGTGSSETSVIGGVDVGDEVCVDSYDDFDNLSSQICVTLGDCVAPTTVLNYAYNTCGHLGTDYSSWEVNNTTFHADGPGDGGPGYDTDYAAHLCVDFEVASSFDFGDGGENAGLGVPGVCGVPTLNVTCRLLKDPDDAADGAVTEPIDIFGLYDGTDTPALGSPGPYTGFVLYDATEFGDWVPFADTIGVAFSENIAMTTAGTIDWNGVTNITSWTIGNNIGVTDDGDTPDGGPDADDTTADAPTVDLVQITVDDVLTLANVDHQEIMDFSAAVEDAEGNPAENAQVVINDLMPPFVVYAYWDGGLTIKFNETVTPDIANPGADTICLWDTAGNCDTISLDGATLSSIDGGTNNRLSIPAGNLTGITGGENFPSVSDNSTYALVYDEDIYDDLGFTGPYNHGGLDFSNIPDARGNTWNHYDSSGPGDAPAAPPYAGVFLDTDGSELCNKPTFAVADVLGPFTVTGIGVSNFQDDAPASCTGAPGASGTMVADVNHVMTYSFSHPLNLERQYWEDADTTGSINCAAASATDLCTLAEVNNGMSDGTWVDAFVLASGTGTGFLAIPDSIGNITELTGVSAVLSPDRMSMQITIRNEDTACYTWDNDDSLNPEWIVWSAFNVGTGKDLNLQVAP